MAIPISEYHRIKDRFCLAYFGDCAEYIVQLLCFRPQIEQSLPGTEIYIAHRKEHGYIVGDAPRTLTKEELGETIREYAYVREFRTSMDRHAVLSLMEESSIDIPVFRTRTDLSRRYKISATGSMPTRSLVDSEICEIKKLMASKGYVEGNSDVGLVIGVESPELFQAISRGIPCILVDKGIGSELVRKMAPNSTVLNFGKNR